eukprot:TRINITY_DN4314_c0_g1_i1.p1 TRINITY_DN4314_c0_g1~~TRINITY_DN4314_c0_g1_i1.p1  ORF type:complete len:319 (+),score=40.86 TRINITY_DN4314_c0_g1_i1:27-959(+)
MRTALLFFLGLVLAAIAARTCPASGANLTSCGEADTCCQATFSATGWGCCPQRNAVCCGNGFTCCPAGTTCKDTGSSYSVVTTCIKAGANFSTGQAICKPGPAKPFSTTLPNCIVLGDSVSIGYTPYLASALSGICDVQHTPFDVSDGGAEETAYGLQCLDFFLSSPTLELLRPDVIIFNFGLHDYATPGNVVPGQSGTPDVYIPQLAAIVTRLRQTGAKLLFPTTTPVPMSAQDNAVVANSTKFAVTTIMDPQKISVVDLYSAVVAVCGQPPYKECSISNSNPSGVHYNPQGYQMLASHLATAVKSLLA